MRIYELAKELKMNSKDLVKLAEQELGITIKNHMSSITDLEVIRLKKALNIINNNKKTKMSKGAKNIIVDDEPLVDEHIDMKQAKLKKVDKNLLTPGKKQPVQSKPTVKAAGEADKNKGNNNNKSSNNSNSNSKNNKNNKNFSKNKNKPKNKQQYQQQPKPAEPEEKKHQPKIKNIEIEEPVIVREFADKLGVPVNVVISKLILLGIMANMNQEIDFDTAQLIGEELGAKVSKIEVVDELQNLEESLMKEDSDDEKDLQPRPPIVTVMGQVRHLCLMLSETLQSLNLKQVELHSILVLLRLK